MNDAGNFVWQATVCVSPPSAPAGPAGPAGPSTLRLNKGESLGRGDSVVSPDGRAFFTLTTEGVLKLSCTGAEFTIWSPSFAAAVSADPGQHLSNQGNGNIVLHARASGGIQWEPDTGAYCQSKECYLGVGNDGILRLIPGAPPAPPAPTGPARAPRAHVPRGQRRASDLVVWTSTAVAAAVHVGADWAVRGVAVGGSVGFVRRVSASLPRDC